MTKNKILAVEGEGGYKLLDSGEGEKLEQFGKFLVARPDPQALWPKSLSASRWDQVQAYFSTQGEEAKWEKRGEPTERWQMDYGGYKFWLKLSSFKHVGLFPEQVANWSWLKETIQSAKRPLKILNLFGYTGGATLAALSAGAEVTHVDASKTAVTWTKDNLEVNRLSDKPARLIVDDAREFVRREIKRGNKYDGIIMDPPAFGRGAKGEVWKIETDFLPLWEDCQKILSPDPTLVLVNGYAAGYSALVYQQNLNQLVEKFGGEIEFGELAIKEQSQGRLLPAGVFARWRK